MFSISRSISRSSMSMAVSGMGFPPSRVRVPDRPAGSGLQVAVHEVDLLQAAKTLADVFRPDFTNAFDRLQLWVGRGKDLVKPAELANDVLHHQLRQPGDAPEDAVATGRDGIVQRVDLAVVAEDLGEATEVEQVLMRQARDAVE